MLQSPGFPYFILIEPMRVDGLDSNTLKLKEIEHIFQPDQIDTNLILRAFKEQETKRIMASSRAHQFQPDKNKQRPQFGLLQVSGRQFSRSTSSFSPNKLQSKSIQEALDRPLSLILQKLSKDKERNLFERELTELRRYSLEHEAFSTARNSTSLKEIEVTRPAFSKGSESRYCQQLVCSNPIFLKKVLLVDKELKNRGKVVKRISKPSPKKYFPLLNRPDLDEDGVMTLLREMQTALALSAGLVVLRPPQGQYKAYVQPGNNGLLIKSLLLTRPWWTLRSLSEAGHCNLIWTEWKSTKFNSWLPKISGLFRPKPSHHIQKKPSHPQIQLRRAELIDLIGENSHLWRYFEPMPSGNYFSFGKKIDSQKYEEYLSKLFPINEYTYIPNPREEVMTNHVPGGLQLHSKKLLFANLREHLRYMWRQCREEEMWSWVPETYHVEGVEDREWEIFKERFRKGEGESKNIWICKPGESSNQGNGISIADQLSQIQKIVVQRCQAKNSQTANQSSEPANESLLSCEQESPTFCSPPPKSKQASRTLIIQKYIEQPLLYKGRKCDLRFYILMVSWGPSLRVYWFKDGYLRTSSRPYSLQHLQNKFVHLTNDAIQKRGQTYGKHEHHNKVGLKDFDAYLQQTYPKDTFKLVMDRIKTITKGMVGSVARKMNTNGRRSTFEVFGLDFMLDRYLRPFLIEANSNPCLEVAGTVLGRVIPSLIENVLRVAVDPLFPAPKQECRVRSGQSNPFQSNKMELIFDSSSQLQF